MNDREQWVDVVEQVLRAHGKRRPAKAGCIINGWECSCGVEVEDFTRHLASEIVADELWATLASVAIEKSAVVEPT